MSAQTSLFHRSLRIAVIGGGTSAERDVSLASTRAVVAALHRLGHDVRTIDPATEELLTTRWAALDLDAAFLTLHGTDGEDGTVQRILATAGVAFTGSGAETSEVAFAKSHAKSRFRAEGVPTPGFALLHEGDHASTIRNAAEAVGYPLVVKPDRQGSSLGIGIVESPDQLSRALVECFQFGQHGLLESYIAGTEWTVSMIDDLVLPLVRITTANGFYDFEAKYESDDTVYDLDFPDVPEEVQSSILEAGRSACVALGTRGLARADVRLDARNQPWVLEVNTLPGMTDHSLVPMAAARAGIGFDELCERAIACAIATSHAVPERTTTARAA